MNWPPHRRIEPVAWACLLATVALGGLCGCSRTPSASVVLIVVDTLRPDHLVTYGYARPTSPSLDEWAATGVVFENAYSSSPWTLPAFGTLFTGHYPTRHGAGVLRAAGEQVASEAQPGPGGGTNRFSRLDSSLATLGEVLRDCGYATAAFVSNPFLHPRFGIDRGFDDYDHAPGRRARVVVDRSLDWIREHSSEPFFVVVHVMDPHLPYNAPEPWRGRFTDAVESQYEPPVAGARRIRRQIPQLSETDKEFIIAAYDEEIAFVDEQISSLMNELERLEAWNDTLVIFTADHGEELFEHGGFEHGHSLYDEVARVPLIVWSTRVSPGRVAAPVSLVDLMPTVLEAVGVDSDLDLSGNSLWPLLQGDSVSIDRAVLVEGMLYGAESKSVILWPNKLILDPTSGGKRLFDLAVDPGEHQDLTPNAGESVERLVSTLELLSSSRPERLQEAEMDPRVMEQLRALGYIR